jgi:Xaa-Pro aminopeptidase
MLDPVLCRGRQRKLLNVLGARKLDAAIFGLASNVYYFASHLPFWQQHAGLILFADGRSHLVAAKQPQTEVAADDVQLYEATWNSTQRQEQPRLVADALLAQVACRGVSRIGIDCSAVSSMAAVEGAADFESLDPDLFQLRRVKDPDELALMKVAIDCCRAMYQRAREIIEPGIAEIEVYDQLHAAAVQVAQEPLSPANLGNDYACGERGGPPRRGRTANPGELYILDLGPAYRGYFSDNCRTISVGKRPTEAQLKAWHMVTGAFPTVERIAKPGAKCRDIYAAVDAYYRESTRRPFPHHLGHGVGLQPHEFPHLNPKWDDTLMEGEIFTAEPGFYAPELAAGLRIENQYRVTATGVENLTPFPMEFC